ncbi:hypothetical protein B0H14DRAFT_1365478 [Mycena olivaceomarginata]|nr:hypothetical protein B0H14DRAFT_1365478 [Mycena olivaceomarginata]
MQRAPHARESRQQLFQGAGFSAADVLQNIEAVTANTIHRDITPPTISAQEEVLKTFHQYVEVMKDSEGYQALNLHSAFDAGASLLSLTVIIGFINYICLSSRGLIDDRITVVTLQNKIGLFLGLTTRLTGKSYASEVTQQLYAYADGECCRSFGLCRDVRVKPVADKVDMSRLLQQLWHPSHSTQSTRMRRQIGFCIKKAALTSSRPGQDVESSAAGYKNTNESLEWRDAEFMILPANSPVPVDDLDPATTAQSMQPSGRPRLCVKLTARLQKGKRGKKGQTLATVFLPEEISPSQPFSGPGHCVVTDLIVMAMADGVFENVRDFDQLGRLMKAVQPGQTIRLQMKDACLKIPILRAYTDGTHFIISQKKALKYAALYKQYESLGKGAGFEDDFRPYCLRRMGGNTLEESAAVTSAQRTQLMGHNQFSRIFQTNYLNTLVAVDLSAIAAGRVEDREAIKAVGRMSMNADVNAPISLSPAGLKRLLQIEEVDKARRVVDQV